MIFTSEREEIIKSQSEKLIYIVSHVWYIHAIDHGYYQSGGCQTHQVVEQGTLAGTLRTHNGNNGVAHTSRVNARLLDKLLHTSIVVLSFVVDHAKGLPVASHWCKRFDCGGTM